MRAYQFFLFVAFLPAAHTRDLGFPEAQTILQTYCKACHGGTARAGGFSLNQIATPESLYSASNTWNRVMTRVRNGEMPPKGRPLPRPKTGRRCSPGACRPCVPPPARTDSRPDPIRCAA